MNINTLVASTYNHGVQLLYICALVYFIYAAAETELMRVRLDSLLQVLAIQETDLS